MSDPRGVQLLEDLVRDRVPVGVRRRVVDGNGARWVRVAAAVAGVVVVGGLVLLWLRRPVPVEEQLPMASPSAAAADVPSGPSSGAGAPPSSGSAPAGPVVVHVAGAVVRPGLVTLPGGGRVADAVQAAGGLRPDADPDRLNLAAPVRDGERVAVPVVGQPLPAAAVGPGDGVAGGSGADGAPAAPVDLNTADAAELEHLPGVGPATAAAIVAHREASGPFRSVDDLLDVRGIGDAKLEALRAAVTVGP